MIHKTTRSILSVLLAALLLVTSTPLTPAFAGEEGAVSLQSESGERGALAGTGTEGDPYEIATAEELREFAKLVNAGKTDADAVLTDDIDLSNQLWYPIGTNSRYRGTFDGNGHTISGLYIDSSSANNQGLFGYVSGTVKDLGVSGSVSGPDSGTGNRVGGVVGYNSGTVKNCYNTGSVSVPDSGTGNSVGGVVGYNSGTVKNCYNTGKVSGPDSVSGNSVGGVVGHNEGGRVENCYNIGEVSGNSSVGGVVGQNIGGIVENCYNTGEVSGNSSVGGVVGLNDGKVTGCYNTGKVSGNSYVGGVVGENSGISTVENCYNTGTVTGTDDRVGGVVGYNFDSVTNCYFLQQELEISGIGDGSGSATPLSAEEFESQENFTSWDFASTWEIESIFGRPTLKDNAEIGGTANNPYKIFTATQLAAFRDLVNVEDGQTADTDAHAKLMNNIDLSSVCSKENGNWTPIGTNSNEYTGNFNGNGHKIENLYINTTDSGADNQGLFGYVSGTVKNLSVTGNVSGDWYVGGVVGYNNGGTVTGCIFSGSGSVSGNRYVGGVVGYNSSGTVTNCAFSGTVTGIYVGGVVGGNSGSNGSVEKCHNTGSVNGSVNSVGGVVGENSGSGPVKNCYNTGKVTGSAASSNVGGVVGLNRGSVENCYNTGSVSGDWYVGGVVGRNDGSVKNCYNTGTGTVTGTVDFVGGVVGQNFGGTVENCYNTGSVSGPDSGSGNSVGGVVGYNGASVTNCYNTGEVSGNRDVGGVVGWNDGGRVANCYYQQHDPAIFGIGDTTKDDISQTAAKSLEDFHSGEVAWRLQAEQKAEGEEDPIPQVWGQSNLTATTSLPTLVALDKANAQTVYQVTFDYGDSFTDNDGRYAYSYTNGVVNEPTKNPELAGHTLSGWYSDPSLTTAWTFDTEISNDKTLYAKWTPVAEPDPDPTPTPTPDPTPSGPSTGDSTGWDDIRDELENAENGDEITIDMGDETKVPAEIFESLAGKDVEISFDLGDIQWSVNGADIPTDTDFTDLDLGVNLDTSGIPVNVINTITGEVGTVQITLAHNGEFGFTMTLTAPLGKENAGYWANLYHYDEDAEALNFEAATKIDEDGSVTIPFTHASQYAIVIDTHSHAAVDVSDLFSDVTPDAWYKDAVQYAYDNGLMTGTSATTFAPEATTTRAMIVSILARLENVTTAEAAGFADVDDNDWYATAVNWAANVGVVNGYEDNTFQPNTAITREQLAAILMNYAAYKGYDVSARADLSHYSDADSISSWANDVLLWAVAEGLLTGVTDDTIAPQAHATRAQVAAILQRFLSE